MFPVPVKSQTKPMKKSKPEPLDRSALKHAAVDLLSRRDYSRQELWRKLSPKAASADDLDNVLNELSDNSWQSDERFGAMYLRSRTSRGLGPVRLRQELRMKGLDDDLTRDLMEQQSQDWQGLATEVAQKKWSALKADDPRRFEKLYRFLAYRGFPSDVIRSVMEQFGTSNR